MILPSIRFHIQCLIFWNENCYYETMIEFECERRSAIGTTADIIDTYMVVQTVIMVNMTGSIGRLRIVILIDLMISKLIKTILIIDCAHFPRSVFVLSVLSFLLSSLPAYWRTFLWGFQRIMVSGLLSTRNFQVGVYFSTE